MLMNLGFWIKDKRMFMNLNKNNKVFFWIEFYKYNLNLNFPLLLKTNYKFLLVEQIIKYQ